MSALKLTYRDGHEETVSVKNLRLYDDGHISYEAEDGGNHNIVTIPEGLKKIEIIIWGV